MRAACDVSESHLAGKGRGVAGGALTRAACCSVLERRPELSFVYLSTSTTRTASGGMMCEGIPPPAVAVAMHAHVCKQHNLHVTSTDGGGSLLLGLECMAAFWIGRLPDAQLRMHARNAATAHSHKG